MANHIGCAQIKVEDDSVYLRLEDKLYEQGIDIRRIHRYFEEIARVVYCNLNKWPNISNKTIVVGCNENKLGIKVFTFLDEIGNYHDTGTFINLP